MTTVIWILAVILLLAMAKPCLGIIIAVATGLVEDTRRWYAAWKRCKK